MAGSLYERLAPDGVQFWPFALFMASAMSITAFPVMARILKERDMTHTTLGRLSLTGAAVADVLRVDHAGARRRACRQRSRIGRQLLADVGRTCCCCARAVVFVALKPLRGLAARALLRPMADQPVALLAALLIGTFACAYVT